MRIRDIKKRKLYQNRDTSLRTFPNSFFSSSNKSAVKETRTITLGRARSRKIEKHFQTSISITKTDDLDNEHLVNFFRYRTLCCNMLAFMPFTKQFFLF